jgi:hypothetical protein
MIDGTKCYLVVEGQTICSNHRRAIRKIHPAAQHVVALMKPTTISFNVLAANDDSQCFVLTFASRVRSWTRILFPQKFYWRTTNLAQCYPLGSSPRHTIKYRTVIQQQAKPTLLWEMGKDPESPAKRTQHHVSPQSSKHVTTNGNPEMLIIMVSSKPAKYA